MGLYIKSDSDECLSTRSQHRQHSHHQGQEQGMVGVVYVSTVYHLSRINEEKILNIFDIFSVERSIKG